MSEEAFRRQLEAVSRDYRLSLPAKLEEIASLWRELASGVAAPARLADLQRELHSIAGAAKTFGIAGASEAASAAEAFLAPYCARRKPPPPARHAGFERLLDALKQAAR